MRIDAALILLVGSISLCGCQTAGDDGLPYMGGKDNFGEANRMTMAAQVIDPNPVYASVIPESSAEHAAQAIDRYRKDKVKKPDRTTTTDSVLGKTETN